ncbi:MAG: phosphotransferase [Candidatus Bathyarchaeota archaeon]|nr:MAG: phosphotransferase [Candidatus Bathyarchaeota archaeon]
MKAYEDLTHRGKLRRIQSVARAALNAFGFAEVDLRFMIDAGNILYRVKAVDSAPFDKSLYVENCFLLRLHWPGYQSDGAVDSELEWLHALSDAGLPVPQPLTTTEGELSVEISVPGVPKARLCSLLRWVKGRMATKHVRRWHLKAIGNLIARLHNHASRWRPSPGFVRRHYDRNGLWGDDTGTSYTADEVWPRIPPRYFDAFQGVTMRVERIIEDWGKRPDVYGLIHVDLGTKANVLFGGREARAIDFDDGGFGYWAYDLAVPLCDWEGEDVWSAYRDALLEGYLEIRSMPKEQLKQLELFQAAFRATEIFWGTACTIRRPDSTYWIERRDEAWRHINRYLKKNPHHSS